MRAGCALEWEPLEYRARAGRASDRDLCRLNEVRVVQLPGRIRGVKELKLPRVEGRAAYPILQDKLLRLPSSKPNVNPGKRRPEPV